VLHGVDRDSPTAEHAALSQPAGPADGAVQMKNKIGMLLLFVFSSTFRLMQ
jgi:hypothetical protein